MRDLFHRYSDLIKPSFIGKHLRGEKEKNANIPLLFDMTETALKMIAQKGKKGFDQHGKVVGSPVDIYKTNFDTWYQEDPEWAQAILDTAIAKHAAGDEYLRSHIGKDLKPGQTTMKSYISDWSESDSAFMYDIQRKAASLVGVTLPSSAAIGRGLSLASKISFKGQNVDRKADNNYNALKTFSSYASPETYIAWQSMAKQEIKNLEQETKKILSSHYKDNLPSWATNIPRRTTNDINSILDVQDKDYDMISSASNMKKFSSDKQKEILDIFYEYKQRHIILQRALAKSYAIAYPKTVEDLPDSMTNEEFLQKRNENGGLWKPLTF